MCWGGGGGGGGGGGVQSMLYVDSTSGVARITHVAMQDVCGSKY